MDNGESIKITILGVRGSIPTSRSDTTVFGGETSCVLFETENDAVFLDAGTGIVNAPDVGDKRVSILITHPHIDHLLGLSFFPYLQHDNRSINIYARPIGGRSARQQIDAFMSEPLWPCTIDDFKANVSCHDITGSFSLNNAIQIDMIDSVHPGGGTVYKLSYGKKSVVYATDYEHDDEHLSALTDFARDCDLLLYDAQYTNEEYEARKGYGHSTVDVGLRVMKESGARQIRFVHHDPRHNDEFLSEMESRVKSDNISFGRAGEVMIL